MTALFLSAAAHFLGFIGLELLVIRFSRTKKLFKRAAINFFVFQALLVFWGPSFLLVDHLFFVGTLVLFWVTYIEVLVCAQNSVSLMLLSKIANAKERQFTMEKLISSGGQANSVRDRVDAMIASGMLLSFDDGRIGLSKAAEQLAAVVLSARRLLSGSLRGD